MPWWGDLLVAVVLLLAALGCVIPLLPGGLLALGAIAVWAFVERGPAGWVVLALAALVIGVGQVVKYLWPGRRLARSDVHNGSLLVGTVLGIVGFFVIPLVGLVVGFVGGVYVAELARTRDGRVAWSGTVEALKATGLSILVELASVLLATAVWLAGVAVTA
jgi:uncharacterized protein YqgC (DUF456 family)